MSLVLAQVSIEAVDECEANQRNCLDNSEGSMKLRQTEEVHQRWVQLRCLLFRLEHQICNGMVRLRDYPFRMVEGSAQMLGLDW